MRKRIQACQSRGAHVKSRESFSTFSTAAGGGPLAGGGAPSLGKESLLEVNARPAGLKARLVGEPVHTRLQHIIRSILYAELRLVNQTIEGAARTYEATRHAREIVEHCGQRAANAGSLGRTAIFLAISSFDATNLEAELQLILVTTMSMLCKFVTSQSHIACLVPTRVIPTCDDLR